MEKLIIENRTKLTWLEVMPYVNAVLEQGKISNNNTQYCRMTTFKDNDKIRISSDKNKKSDRLVIW